MNIWQKRAPGVLLCLAVALLAWFLVELAPALEIVGSAVLAILFGMVLCAVMKNKDKVKDGVAFTSKKILQYAVILLGFGLNLSEIAKVGAQSLPIILLHHLHLPDRGLPHAQASAYARQHLHSGGRGLLHLRRLRHRRHRPGHRGGRRGDRPVHLGDLPVQRAGGPDLPHPGRLPWACATRASACSPARRSTTPPPSRRPPPPGTPCTTPTAVLEYATIVKLTRTLAIIPITLALALWRTWQAKRGGRRLNGSFDLKKMFPFFILFFVLASVITTVATVAGVDASAVPAP